MKEKNSLEQLKEKMREESSLPLKVDMFLKYIGVPQEFSGYNYIKEAVLLGLSDHNYLHNIIKGLYPEIAKKYNSTDFNVELCIHYAVQVCMENIEENSAYFYIFKNPKSKMNNAYFISAIVHFFEDLD